MKYFAFGSNMNLDQMKKRCPGSTFLTSATLEDFRFVYDGKSDRWGGAVGNIVPSEGESVKGALFEINDGDLLSLDQYEGFPNRYKRRELPVKSTDNMKIMAILYFRDNESVGSPSEAYKETVISGARECGIPEDYIQKYLDAK